MNRDKTKLLNRLHRIGRQVRGIADMIQNDRDCIDLLTQLRAARGAMRRVETELLKVHVAECVRTAITGRNAKERLEKAEEPIRLLERGA